MIGIILRALLYGRRSEMIGIILRALLLVLIELYSRKRRAKRRAKRREKHRP